MQSTQKWEERKKGALPIELTGLQIWSDLFGFGMVWRLPTSLPLTRIHVHILSKLNETAPKRLCEVEK